MLVVDTLRKALIIIRKSDRYVDGGWITVGNVRCYNTSIGDTMSWACFEFDGVIAYVSEGRLYKVELLNPTSMIDMNLNAWALAAYNALTC